MSDHLRSLAIELLIGAADATLIYLCYKWYKNDCAAAEHIEKLDAIDWKSLKSQVEAAPEKCIEYGIVDGTVQSVNGSLKSQFTDAEGPVKHFKRVLLKSERHRGYWSDSQKTLSESYDKLPFALLDPLNSGLSLLVIDPKSAAYFQESLHTTCDNFEPTNRSVTQSMFDRVVGEIEKGYQTTEQILKNGCRMLGVGKIVLKHDSLELQSPSDPKMPYILTSMSKTELIEHLKSKAKLFKILTGIFGVAGLVILWVTAGGRFKKWLDDRRARAAMDDIRAQLARMRETEGSDQSPAADNNTNVCVICLTNNRDICNRPCGHVCSCVTCYEAMPAPRKCPVCREAIVSILPVYLP